MRKLTLEQLIEIGKNAPRNGDFGITSCKKSIKDFEFNDPIAIDENNTIIEGHGRYEALKQLGYKEVFGLPGSYIMPIWQEFGEDIKIVLNNIFIKKK